MKPINAAPHGLLQTLQREQLATPLLCVPWSRQPHLTMCDLQSAAAHVVQPLWAAFWLQTPTSVTVCVCVSLKSPQQEHPRLKASPWKPRNAFIDRSHL